MTLPLHVQAASPSSRLLAAARAEPQDVLASLGSSLAGLSAPEAARRLERDGPNLPRHPTRGAGIGLVTRAVGNPLAVLLGVLSASSFAAGDTASGGVMVVLLVVAVGLRLVQEARATAAAASLKSMIAVHASVIRDGSEQDVPIGELVRGDVVHLAVGDMVPADVRFLAAKDLSIMQAILTGESFPVEKHAGVETDPTLPPPALGAIGYEGTSVASGSGLAVVVETGGATLLGSVAATLDMPEAESAFDAGIRRFTWLMISLAAVMTPLVILINGLTKGDWWSAQLFGLAVAVGLTPEMLPTIVAACLSQGAVSLAKRRVIVKHVDSVQNLGAMDVLCTDKTGTLTQDRIILERHCNVALHEDSGVLALAWLTSHFQTGLRNLLDRGILEYAAVHAVVPPAGELKIDEIPFDFSRRMMSVVVAGSDGHRRLVCKGAPDAILARCHAYELDGTVHPLGPDRLLPLEGEWERLAGEGFRLLAVASRSVDFQEGYSRADERDLVLHGYLSFLDPPKDSAAAAIEALIRGGVQVKVLTGDSEVVSRTICRAVGLDASTSLCGDDVERMSDSELLTAAQEATLLARLAPLQKQRVVRLLKEAGHVVGYLGDGVNDAPALREADVGLTVDTAVDLARESADCILLDKDLQVLWEGVREGRRVFANVVKYVRMGASSNFGNILSMVVASGFLPYLPMTPLQILTANLLYDCSQAAIPTDTVDDDVIARPQPWSTGRLARFILLVGPCSSLFDIVTFLTLWFAFGCSDPSRAALFHTGWFVESLVTQTLVIHVIRTERIPFLESRASLALTVTTAAVVLVGIGLAESELGALFGFVPLPAAYWPFLGMTALVYGVTVYRLKAAGTGAALIEAKLAGHEKSRAEG
jgi:Mg2+-importing ATPase